MTPQHIYIDEDNNKFYYKDKAMKIRHREDGPAIEYADGYKAWFLNGKRHREDGAAIEDSDGYKAWWLNDVRHREDGPAIEDSDGYKAWFLNGKRHREDGPAVEYPEGFKAWFLNNRRYTEEEFKKRTAKEITLTMDEIAERLSIDVAKLKIKK